jgi:hypothetical protein
MCVYVDDSFYGIKQLFILQTLYSRRPTGLLLTYVEFISDILLCSYTDIDELRRNCQDFLNLRFRQSKSRPETVTSYKLQLLTH